MRAKLEELKKRVETETLSAKKSAEQNKHSANLISGGLIGGYSIAGDVEHSRNTALLSMQRFEKLTRLDGELKDALIKPAPEKVEPACLVLVEYDGGEKKDFYFVNNPVYIPGLNLISYHSPFGKALLGKVSGETFSYTSNDIFYSGKVLEID
jgi:hypothetical protein